MGSDVGVLPYVRERLRAFRATIADDEMIELFDEEVAQRLAPLNDDTGWSPDGEEAALIPGEDMLDWLEYFRDCFADGDKALLGEGS